ncbi:hypothetical protein Y032_0268g782 [Ancylostoma ceylanicum]|nr:hypothetical protein Y032_0268g782 [Ancylostoma ceylanicum]
MKLGRNQGMHRSLNSGTAHFLLTMPGNKYAVACEPNVERVLITKATPARTYFNRASTSALGSVTGESDPENKPSTSAGFKRSRC